MKKNREEVVMTIGKRMKHFRKFTDLTQEKAADLLHISKRTLASYERGEHEPTTNTVQNMAAIYHTTFEKITDYKNIPLDIKPFNQMTL